MKDPFDETGWDASLFCTIGTKGWCYHLQAKRKASKNKNKTKERSKPNTTSTENN